MKDLRGLERDGLVTRTVFPTIPPRVEYELTELGHSLSVAVAGLGGWVRENLSAIETARAKFDTTMPTAPQTAMTGDARSPGEGAVSRL